MKSLLKKALILILAVCMAVMTFGCAGNEPSDGDSTGDPSATNGTNGGSVANVSQEFLDNLKGTTMKIVYPDKQRSPGQNPMDDEWSMIVSSVAKDYGVTITEECVVNKGNGGDFITDILSGNVPGQMLNVWFNYSLTGSQKNAWASLDEAAKEAGVDFNAPHYATPLVQACNIDGHQYGISFKTQFTDFYAIYYNVDMITVENKLEDPLELYERGEWTFDKFEEYCKILTKKDANGDISVYGCMLPAAQNYAELVLANGGSIGRINSSGKWQQTLADSKTVNALNYLYKWTYQDQCIWIPSGSWGTSYQNLYDGTTAMALGSGATALDSYLKVKDEGGIGVVPLPVGPDGTKEDSLKYVGGFVFTVPSTYQEDAAKYLFLMDQIAQRWYANYENAYRAQCAAIFNQDKYYDMFYKLMSGEIINGFDASGYSLVYDSTGYSDSMMYLDISNGVSPATAVDRYASVMQSTSSDNWGDSVCTGLQE